MKAYYAFRYLLGDWWPRAPEVASGFSLIALAFWLVSPDMKGPGIMRAPDWLPIQLWVIILIGTGVVQIVGTFMGLQYPLFRKVGTSSSYEWRKTCCVLAVTYWFGFATFMVVSLQPALLLFALIFVGLALGAYARMEVIQQDGDTAKSMGDAGSGGGDSLTVHQPLASSARPSESGRAEARADHGRFAADAATR